MKPLYNILEQWADKVKPKWHPKEGLFTGDNPQEIADYLLKHSEDKGQAMKRLMFYMNRAGDDCPNKTVLNKVKKLLSESLLDKDFDITDKQVMGESAKVYELFRNSHWKKRNGLPIDGKYLVSKDFEWYDFLEFIINEKHRTKDYIEVQLLYPYSSTSERLKASSVDFMYDGVRYSVQYMSREGEVWAYAKKGYPLPDGNIYLYRVPKVFAHIIKGFVNENT